MERFKIELMTLRPDQASRLYEYGFKLHEIKNPMQWIYNTMSVYDVLLPKTAEVTRMPEASRGGLSGIARIQPRDKEGYVREFHWRPAVDEVPARMTGFPRLDEYVRKPDKKEEHEQTGVAAS
jgi:hypothetical protein